MAGKKADRILWAVDPFAENDFGWKIGAQGAQLLSDLWKIPVEPVYELSPEGFRFPGDFSPSWIRSFLPYVKKALAEKVEKYGKGKILPSKIIVSRSGNRRKGVKRILGYAKRQGGAPIVVTTHGRAGLSRWFLGSFTETLILAAKTPLLVVSVEQEIKPVKTILFPTNLSKKSVSFIKKQVAWIKKQNAKVILYHKLHDAVDPFIHSGMTVAGGGWVSLQPLMQEESLRKQKAGDKLVQDLKAQGISTEFVMDSEMKGLAEAVVSLCKAKGVDLIALLTEADAVNAGLLGSLARQLSRSAPCPLWLQHS